MPLSAPAATSRENSLTFLRLAFALLVVCGHSWVLGGFGEEPLSRLIGGALSGRELAVQGFFVLSGFLIAKSLSENPSLWRFACHRAFRILPAFWVYLLGIVFIVAPWLIALRWPGRFTYAGLLTLGPQPAWAYFQQNWALQGGQFNIAPLFAENPVRFDVNGSLWSVCFEAKLYLYAAAAAAARLLPARAALLAGLLGLLAAWFLGWIVAGFFFIACLWRVLIPTGRGPVTLFAIVYAFHAILTFAPDWLQALPIRLVLWLLPVFDAPFRISALAFLGGALCWRYRAHLRFETRWFLLAFAVLITGVACGQWSFVMPLALPYLVLFLGFRLPRQLQKVEHWGDYSYGIYIFSFPLQQLLIQFGLARTGLPTFLAASLLLSLAAGIFSWFCIEKPALHLGQKLGAWRPGFMRSPLTAPQASATALSTTAVTS